MKLAFAAQRMLLAHLNPRSELHGEERTPAGDLKLEAALPNDVLNALHARLKASLYQLDKGREQDLADQGRAHEPGFLPHLIFPSLGAPLKWEEEMIGVKVTIGHGISAVVLEDCKVNGVQFSPKDGGTVEFSMRVQAHPDAKAFGMFSTLVQQEVDVTLEPGAEPGAA